jgi:hypothetical protein
VIVGHSTAWLIFVSIAGGGLIFYLGGGMVFFAFSETFS